MASEAFAVDVDPAPVGLDARRLARIGTHFQRYVDDGRLPGWSFAVSRRARIAHVGRCGSRDIEADLPVELDTLFRICSMTKPVTTIAAMMLYEQGAFELTDPVAKFIPAFAQPRVYVGGSDLRYRRARPAGRGRRRSAARRVLRRAHLRPARHGRYRVRSVRRGA